MTDEIKSKNKKSKSSFYYAFNLLPAFKRDAMNIVYAFCRETDDIVDENGEKVDTKYQKLVRWRTELEQAFYDNSEFQLLNKFAAVLKQFKIPADHCFELIKGMEMDLIKNRYENFEELYEYCYRAASTVGLICVEIFGYKHHTAKQFAIDLGIALQLTNIIRDVSKDAENNRIYIPREEMNRFGYSEEDLLNHNYNYNYIRLMEFQAVRAKKYFQSATADLNLDDKLSMFAARAMQHIYYNLLEKIIAAKYDVFNKNINATKLEKVGISLGVWAKYNLVYR